MDGQYTHAEISSQDEAIRTAWNELKIQLGWVDKYLCDSSFDEVIFIGSGSSYYQALTMAAAFRTWLKRSATAYPSSELFLLKEQTAPDCRKYLVIGVSRSGESTEILLAINAVKDDPNITVAGITCYENSSMAKLVPCLVSPLGKEMSTVMTKSFSSMTFLMQAAVSHAANHEIGLHELSMVVNRDLEVVRSADEFVSSLVDNHRFNKYIYLGMGGYYGIALEASLKIKEMSYVWTEAYSTLEFRHGPKSIVEPGTFVCLLLSQRAREYEIKVGKEMREYGAHVMVVTAKADGDTQFADSVFEIGGADLSDEARTVLYLPALQYLGYYTALSNHVNPDEPRNLTQVVRI